MRAVVVAGSHLSNGLDPAALARADLLVAVDSGADALLAAGVTPGILVGDMDSIAAPTLYGLRSKSVETVTLPAAKDETDTEAALRLVIARGADDITVYGALGGPRLDHLLGNLLLMAAPWLGDTRVRMVDDHHEAFLVKGDVTFTGRRGDTVSLIPLTAEVERVRSEGLLYPLAGDVLVHGATRGISNEMTGDRARVSHGAGKLLLIHYQGR